MSQHDIDVAYEFAQTLQDDETADPAQVIAHLAAYFSIPNPMHKDMDGKEMGGVYHADMVGAGK